jgi:hypothetical protein
LGDASFRAGHNNCNNNNKKKWQYLMVPSDRTIAAEDDGGNLASGGRHARHIVWRYVPVYILLGWPPGHLIVFVFAAVHLEPDVLRQDSRKR